MIADWHRRRIRSILLSMALAISAHSAFPCDDYVLSEGELSSMLDRSLGDLRSFVTHRSVTVDPQVPSCYLKMEVSLEALGGTVGCTLSACSIGVASGRRLGINTFRIGGCDQIFDLVGADRRVKTVYADVTERIRSHCGSDAFRIANIVPQRANDVGSIRLVLAPME